VIIQPENPVILASASPRRKELLTQLGLKFEIIPAHIDESQLPGESPLDHVRRLAEEKGQAVARLYPGAIIISSDTIVLFEDRILGKPENKDDAYRILSKLSGMTHKVITAFSIMCIDKGWRIIEHEVTNVHFRQLSDKDIYDYIAGGSPMDKAGAYGIQDLKANFVDSIEGCFYNVIGFPVAKFNKIWNRLFNNKT
jgi:septum formation protein